MDLIKIFKRPKDSSEFPENGIIATDMSTLTFQQKEHEVKPATEGEFAANAFFLFEHMAAVLNDSRMFLSPLIIDDETVTLGAIIENLRYCLLTPDISKKPDMLPYNYYRCPYGNLASFRCVNRDGAREMVRGRGDYFDILRMRKHRKHYNETIEKYEVMSLEEVVSALRESPSEENIRLQSTIMFQRWQNALLLDELVDKSRALTSLRDGYDKLNEQLHQKEVQEFIDEYKQKKATADKEIISLKESISIHKRRMKNGEFTPDEYRALIEPMGKRIVDIEKELARYKFVRINEFCSHSWKDYAIITNALNEIG